MRLLVLVLLLSTSAVFCQTVDESKVQQSFVKHIENVANKLKSDTGYLHTDSDSDSPTGQIYLLEQILDVTVISYDIQKTNSIVSPYIGFLTLSYRSKRNGEGGRKGDFEISSGSFVYSKLEDCLKDSSFAFSASKTPREDIEIVHDKPYETTITFKYQNGKWTDPSTDDRALRDVWKAALSGI